MLDIAPGLQLAPEAALQRFGILAMSGAGKSNTAVVMAEEMFRAGIPWVAIDPKGDWWGIRSSSDGKKPGLPIPVFGGLEGDVPLEATGGKLVAELVAEDRLTCVLDVSEFESKGQQMRFLTDFATTLLRRNRAPLHIFAEEADEYLPQRVFKDEAKCVGAWTRLVKRGRFRGVFVTLITQRSSALSKDALSQVDTLIPMRVAHDLDKKAIKLWVAQHNIGPEMFESLPFLEDGEAWLWSPQKLKVVERVRFRRRETFDSGATPDWEARPPATLAEIDLAAVTERMADTIEKAKAEDPRELRRRIAELESRANAAPASEDLGRVKEEAWDAGYNAGAAERESSLAPLLEASMSFADLMPGIAANLHGEIDGLARCGERIQHSIDQLPAGDDTRSRKPQAPVPPPPGAGRPRVAAPRGASPPRSEDARVTPSQQKILDALACFDALAIVPKRAALAPMAGSKPSSGGFKNNLGALRSGGLLDYPEPNRVALTEEGTAAANQPEAVPTVEDLHLAVLQMVVPAQRTILSALIDAYPNAVDRERLANTVGVSHTSGGFKNNLGALRTLELIDYPTPGWVIALPVLFMEDR